MSKTCTLSVTMSTPDGPISGSSVSVDGSGVGIDDPFTAGKTDYEYTIAFPYTRLKKFVAKCSVDCILEFNNSTTGVPTLALAAGVPFVYDAAQPYANPFTADVTKVYLTATPAGTLQIYALYDPTP